MGLLDGPLRAVSKTILDTFGTSLTVTQTTPGVYDPEDGNWAVTTTAVTVNGRLDDHKAHELTDEIRATDQKLTLPAIDLSFEPGVGDTVTVGAAVYGVVNVSKTLATDSAAIFELAIRLDA